MSRFKRQKGGAEAPPFRETTESGLVNQVFCALTRAAETSDLRPGTAVEGAVVEDQSEVALGNRLRERTRTDSRDERVCVTVLELRLGDDVAGETVGTVIQAVCTATNRAAATAEHVRQD